MSRELRAVLGYLLAVGIGISGALLAAHWAACEQHEGFCSISK